MKIPVVIKDFHALNKKDQLEASFSLHIFILRPCLNVRLLQLTNLTDKRSMAGKCFNTYDAEPAM